MWLFRASPYASVCVGRYLESRLSDIPRHPHPRLPGGRLKSRKYKKSAVGGKKSPANAGTKRDYLFFYRQVLNRWNNTISCFFTANGGLFYGQRPLFEPCRLLSSCKAWRWGWRRRQGGKLVFRLASPTATKRRSRQQPPWLFVFISTPNRSSY